MSESQDNSARRHETTDADIGKIVRFGVGLFLTVLVSLIAMRAMFNYFVEHQGLGPPASPFENTRKLPPEDLPRLQVAPPQDLNHYEDSQQEMLNGYGWVDAQAGVVHIPIEKAMDLLIERGLPVETGKPAQGELQPGTVQQYTVPQGFAPVR
jgi:hypothetical protein